MEFFCYNTILSESSKKVQSANTHLIKRRPKLKPVYHANDSAQADTENNMYSMLKSISMYKSNLIDSLVLKFFTPQRPNFSNSHNLLAFIFFLFNITRIGLPFKPQFLLCREIWILICH